VWDKVKMDFREIRWRSMHQIHLAQDGSHWMALVKTVMKLRF
jgi:hypothetical protein